ncbi:hypothetical protein EIN_055150 [Entamoeba invadens IP1]|uniref:hypothetical protein n=1 Tax=Entamoeba invadens IP1 TaxID=370355 RepID=UPI0002C3D1A2|nr:hypothetical protein EIN_055150 [Entamoeba invadens IP1]ELP93210.1 hypothetical protein EIN_055150 [Entamoeba invadens IP1]|eukprot:XP_004259981.1 hypothetical protein EIN_055150 [Entamoeba invadens IP1]
MSSFISDYSQKHTFDDYVKILKQLLGSNTETLNEHWGVIWASLSTLLEMTLGTLASGKLKIASEDSEILKGEFIQQLHIIDLSEEANIHFNYALDKTKIFENKDFMKISQNQSFSINRFNILSRAHKEEIGQLIQTHSPITYTFMIKTDGENATVLHFIYLPILRLMKQSASPYYLICLTLVLPLPKEKISENIEFKDPQDEKSEKNLEKTDTKSDETQNEKEAKSGEEPFEIKGEKKEEETIDPVEEGIRKVFEKQNTNHDTMIQFEAVKGLSIYRHTLELLTDSINLMIYNATLDVFKYITIQNFQPEKAKKLAKDNMNNTILNITECFSHAVKCLIFPSEFSVVTALPQVLSPKDEKDGKKEKKEKKPEMPFNAKFLSMVLTAHLETYFTIVLVNTQSNINFFHTIFSALNPPNFSTTTNIPFTSFPFFLPKKNMFLRTIYITELEQNSLYDIPLPYCVVNCLSMQVAVSKSVSTFEHFSYRATAHIVRAAKILHCQIPIATLPPERSIRMLQRCPTTEIISNRILNYYFSGKQHLCYIELSKFIEYYQQKARIVLSVVKSGGVLADILTELEDIFVCNEADEMMLILSFLKSDLALTARFFALIEKRVRIDY